MKTSVWLACSLLFFSGVNTANHVAAGARPPEGESGQLIRTHGLKINVDDMEKALAFYCGKLGFEVEDRGAYPERVVLKSEGRNKLILNRVEKLGRPSPQESKFAFTLQVNDLDRAIERMRSLGVEFGEPGKRKEGVGDAIYIRDPFGRLISLMHQTIVKVEPFKEPRLYNFGFLIPDMEAGRDFYSNKLGFVVRSEKYLPGDLPLGNTDKTFAFMLHYREGVRPARGGDPEGAPFNTLVFETGDLSAAVKALEARGVKILRRRARKENDGEQHVAFEDPFGNVSELIEASKPAGR